MSFTTLQMIFDVLHTKKKMELGNSALTAEQVAGAYKQVDFAVGAEAVSDAFVDTCCTLGDRALCIDQVRDILLNADAQEHNIFNGWTKLQTIVGKAGSEENIKWAFCAPNDMWRTNKFPDRKLPLRSVLGTKELCMGGKGLVELVIFKKELFNSSSCCLSPHACIFKIART